MSPTLIRRSAAVLALLAVVGGVPALAAAACPDLREVAAIRKGLRDAFRCEALALRKAGTVCAAALPATAAGQLALSALALAFGNDHPADAPVDVNALGAQLTCQRQIARGVGRYLDAHLPALVTGASSPHLDARARRELDRIAERCATTFAAGAGGTVLPAVGGACASLVGPAGSAVDGAGVRDCLLGALGLGVAQLAEGGPQATTTTVIIVRHAERDPGEDPPLTSEGEIRSQALASALAGADVSAIFTTHFIRNQQTAAPLATLTGAPVVTVAVGHILDWPGRGHLLAQSVLAGPRGGVIVVIGHTSGFNSAVSADLGGPAVAETYAAMTVLTLLDGGPTRAVFARYGAQSTLDPL